MAHELTLIEKKDLGPQVSILSFEAPADFRQDAGQWVQAYWPTPDGELKRIYSLASPPCSLPRVDIAVRLFEDSEGGAAVGALEPGSKVRVEDPQGKFLFEVDKGQPVLHVATSVAIAPVRAHLFQADHDGSLESKTQLFHGVHAEGVLPFQDEFERLAGRVRGFDYQMKLLGEGVDEATPEAWQTLVDDASRWVDDLSDASSLRVFLAGHGGMVKPLKEKLTETFGVPADHIKTEQFWK